MGRVRPERHPSSGLGVIDAPLDELPAQPEDGGDARDGQGLPHAEQVQDGAHADGYAARLLEVADGLPVERSEQVEDAGQLIGGGGGHTAMMTPRLTW